MNHFLLPSRQRFANDDDVILAGDYSMEVLVNAMLSKGAHKNRLVAKAFGGGNVIDSINIPIGECNAIFAAEWLEREGIPMQASDFGGPWSRKVICVPQTGDVYCRRIPVKLAIDVARQEAAYERLLARFAGNRTELF